MSDLKNDKPCLHCALLFTIREYYRLHGGKDQDGKSTGDAIEAISDVASCIPDLVANVPDKDKDRAIELACEVLDDVADFMENQMAREDGPTDNAPPTSQARH